MFSIKSQSLGKFLIENRIGLTEFSKECGLSRNTIVNALNNKNIHFKTLCNIIKFMTDRGFEYEDVIEKYFEEQKNK